MPFEESRFSQSDSKLKELGEVEDESKKSPENTEGISFAETALCVGLLGLKAYLIYDSKKEEIQKVIDEAKQDFGAQPSAAKEVVGGLAMQLSSLVLEYQREQQEQKLRIRQKFLSSFQRMATARNQLDLLKDYEVLQGEAIQETLSNPQERISATEEEKANFRSSVDPVEKARQEAKNKVISFINSLMGLSG